MEMYKELRHMVNVQNAVSVHYQENGQGMPVLLLHGFPFDHHIWRAQVEALKASYRVITPDLRGHGQSSAPEGVYDMELMVADLVVLLDNLGIDRAVWVGHSMGGYITMAALRTVPERIMGIGLVATHPYADSDDKRMQRRESAELALRQGSTDVAFSMMSLIFSPRVEGKSPMAQDIYNIMVNTTARGIAGALRGMANRPDSVETLRNADIPAVVIAGADDQIVKRDTAEMMAALMPRAALVEIENAGHLPMIEQPEATTAALRTFLQSVSVAY
jgi:pimeloyl-ACP methyl ester carboxylesterase